MKFRSFTESDWMSYSGAENITEDIAPLIADVKIDGKDGEIIISKFGIEIHTSDDNESRRYFLENDETAAGVITIMILRDKDEFSEIEIAELGFSWEVY